MTSLVKIGPVVREKKIFKLAMYFRYFVIIFPWKRAGPFIWTNLNPLNLRTSQIWLKLAKWFGRRRLVNFVNVFSLFHDNQPLEKSGALHLNKLESPSSRDTLCQVWLKLDQWFWRRRWKCEKFTDGPTGRQTTDDRWSEKLTWAFSSGELKNNSSWQD